MSEVMGLRTSDTSTRLLQNHQIQKIHRELNEASFSRTTGLKGPTYDLLPESALESQMAKVNLAEGQKTLDVIGKIKDERTAVEESFNRFETIMVNFSARLKNVMSSAVGDPGFKTFCQQSLDQVQAILNESKAGVHIFSGVKEGDPPVGDLRSVAVPNLGFDLDPQNYSNFTSTPPLKTINIMGFKVENTHRYDNPEIKDMIHALLIGAHFEGTDRQETVEYKQLERSGELAESSLKAIGNRFSVIGTQDQAIEDKKESSEKSIHNQTLYLKQTDSLPFLETESLFQNLILAEKLLMMTAQQGIKRTLSVLENMM